MFLSIKARIGVSLIFSLPTFILLWYEWSSFKVASIIGLFIFVIILILLNPYVIQWNKEKSAQNRYYNSIRREEYVRREGQLSAERDFSQRKRNTNPISGPSFMSGDPFGHLGFTKKKRK